MNIAFWSEEDGCGTTSGMTAIASVCSNVWNMKTILMQSRNQKGDLCRKLDAASKMCAVREEGSCYVLDGLDYLLWQVKNKKLSEAMISDSMVPVIKDHMYYLPQAECGKPGVYTAALKAGMWQIIKESEHLSDLTFVDCGSGEDELSAYVLARADAVVVSISQERRNLDVYFEKRHAFRGKVIYLVNQYQQESVYNRKNLRRLYRLGSGELAVIPHNPVFRHACDKGRTERFVRRHIRCITLDSQFYFMQELIRTTNMILKTAGFAECMFSDY